MTVWACAAPAWAGVSEVALGVREQVEQARLGLQDGQRSWAMGALHAARRVTDAAANGSRGDVRFRFDQARWAMDRARRALQNGDVPHAVRELAAAERALVDLDGEFSPRGGAGAYVGSPVVNALGETLGEVRGVRGDLVTVALGAGALDPFGWFGHRRDVEVPTDSLVLGEAGGWRPDVVVLASGVTLGELQRLSFQLADPEPAARSTLSASAAR